MTSTSALKRAAPYRIAAWAPKRYQGTPIAAKARPRSARTSPSGERVEGTGGAIDRAFEGDVMGEILAPLAVGGPIGAHPTHVLPE